MGLSPEALLPPLAAGNELTMAGFGAEVSAAAVVVNTVPGV